jgi:hypothetical protein
MNAWLNNMGAELESCAGRMSSTLAAALDEAQIDGDAATRRHRADPPRRRPEIRPRGRAIRVGNRRGSKRRFMSTPATLCRCG